MQSELDGEATLLTKAEQTSAMKVKPPSPKVRSLNSGACSNVFEKCSASTGCAPTPENENCGEVGG